MARLVARAIVSAMAPIAAFLVVLAAAGSDAFVRPGSSCAPVRVDAAARAPHAARRVAVFAEDKDKELPPQPEYDVEPIFGGDWNNPASLPSPRRPR